MNQPLINNTGKPFEKHVLEIAEIYATQKLLRLAKTDPPVRVVGFGVKRKVIFMANPFLDFCGCWTERQGRAVFLELKSTHEPELAMDCESGGLTTKQLHSMHRWYCSGAAVGLLWESRGQVRFVNYPVLHDRWQALRRVIHFHHGEPVRQGKGFVLFDYLENLRNAYPLTTP